MFCTVSELADFVRAHDDYAIITHFKPDGDAYGCALGLVNILRGIGKRAFPVCDDSVETKYRFLEGWEEFTNEEKGLPFEPRTALGVDVSDANRMGASRALFERCPYKAAIDHHVSNVGLAPLTLLEAEAAAAAEPVLKLAQALGFQLTKAVAEQLYTALVTDSGNFSFRDTRGTTMRAAAECLDAGADADELTRILFRERTVAKTRLIGMALSSFELAGGGRVAGIRMSAEMFRQSGADLPDAHSIVNYMNEMKGVDIGILCEERPDAVRISFRASGDTDVSKLAARFGGGGHTAAAGARIEGGKLDEIFQQAMAGACEYLGVEE